MNKQQQEAKDLQFAYKVRHALDRNLENLPAAATERLAAARALALSRKKQGAPLTQLQPAPRLAGAGGGAMSAPRNHFGLSGWLGRLGIVLPILLGIVLFVGLYQSEERNRIDELAEIDSAILSDELPISAYLDHGFKAFIAKQDQ